MNLDDSLLDRSSDLIGKIRKLREASEKEMNRFTSVADYDVRRVVGQKPIQEETPLAASAGSRARKKTSKPSSTQTAIDFSPAPAEPGDDGEGE